MAGDRGWETPPRSEIPGISRAHVAGMEASDRDTAWVIAEMHHLILHTRGRRTGATHKVALPYFVDSTGATIVVASFAGSTNHPAWYLNLADRAANPDLVVRLQHGLVRMRAEVLTGSERARVWSELVSARDWYAEYQRQTARDIPLVRLRLLDQPV